MKFSLWRLIGGVMCVACLLLGLAVSVADGASQEASGGLGSFGGLESPLAEPVGGGRQAAEEAMARLSSPEVLAEDARSRTAFSDYRRREAVALAERVFGIAAPHWTAPQDQGSGKITGYVGENMAQEVLPDGKHVLVDSSLPLRSSVGDGQLQPVSLGLSSTGAGYVPANPLVPVVIGKNAAEGVSFEFGLQMAPVAHADPEAPQVVGDSVFFPGTSQATDFMVEPRPLGAEASWQLLSAESSGENALSFTLPAGAQLVMSKELEGAAEVMLEGQRQLMIMPATATEANGAGLPVTYSVNGSTLTTHVDLSGNVAYPVDVDPVVWQKYGGSGYYWGGWSKAEGEKAGVADLWGGSGAAEVFAAVKEGEPSKSWANWSLFAPGFKAGEGSLTRMDVTKLGHGFNGQSNVEAGIVNSNGSIVYTYDGENPADTKSGMLLTSEGFENRPVAFCADGAGGYDGGPTPLCNESYGGEYFRLTVDTWASESNIQWTSIEANTARFLDTSNIKAAPSEAATIEGQTNVLTGSEKWLGPKSGKLEAIGSDPAFGVAKLAVSIAGAEHQVSREYALEGDCSGIICAPEGRQPLSYSSFGKLPNGNDAIKIEAADASGLTAIWSSTVHVDNTPPHGLAVTGADVHGETISITEGQAGDQITVEATDGEGGVPSSGIAALGVEIDEHAVGSEQGHCAPGPCTAKATWTLNGRELGAGEHTLRVKAIDNAGNEEEHKSYELVVHAASPIAMGPGSVNPESGDFALEAADVDLKDVAGTLAVSQHYDSRNVYEGVEGPLGPAWAIGLGHLASLEVLEGSEGKVDGVIAAGAEGLSFFKANGNGGFEPPPADLAVSLTHPTSGEYVLENKDKGTATTFTLPEGAKHWLPTVSKTGARTNTLTDEYKTVKVGARVIVEPTEELAPHGEEKCPQNIAEMQAGCRALRFYYNKEQTEQSKATGENRSEWGWYENPLTKEESRLTKIDAVVWNTSAGKMEEVAVAEFAYDNRGRLRAEWDPRIKPELKTIYGYDSENHVTAESAPGQQPWLMTYGTTAGDASPGRLIKVMRPKASEALWGGQLPEKTEEPTISGSPVPGNRMAVSNGKWAHEALIYGYQWEDCNSSGEGCAPIAGATNANYTPVSGDLGHKLVVEVSATNAGGTTTTLTAKSTTVASSPPGEFVRHAQSIDSGKSINAASCLPETTSCVVSDSKGNAFYATNVSTKSEATWHSWTGPGTSPSEAVDCPSSGLCLLADGSHGGNGGSLYYASSLGGSWKEAYTPSYGVDAIACVSASLCVDGQDGDGYLRDSTKPASSSWTQVAQGTAAMTAASCLSSSFCALADSAGDVHIAPTAKAIESGSWTQTSVDGSTALTGIACPTTSSCLAVDGTGNALEMSVNTETGAASGIYKVDLDGTNALTGISCATTTSCASVDNHGDLLVSAGTTTTNALGGDLTSVSCASKSLCLTGSTTGEVVAFNPTEEVPVNHEAAQQPLQPGTTLEYAVPVSGGSAPYAMGSTQVKEWAQKDDPAEGFEVFPEEHAQGWPASGHAGATVYYMDDEANTVNVIAPSEGISTNEYNEGEMVRSLTADNQAKALKESNHAEAAEKLASESKYSEHGQLTEVTGPEHKVKLSDGEEVNARNHTRYFYDEGAPENEKGEIEEYGLVTKTTDGALLASGEEKDVRTTLTGYAGQNGLGWTLRAPTSTTTEPNNVDLVSSTKYNVATGAVEETRTPGGNAETVSPPEPKQRIGSEGTGNSQFKEPMALAVSNSNGVAAVLDSGNNRIETFSSEGVFRGVYGSAGSGHGQFSDPQGIALNQKTGNVYVADTNNNRVEELNSEGKYVGEWCAKSVVENGTTVEACNKPTGIAIDASGHVWVANHGDDHIDEFTETGQFIQQFGSQGIGNGQFEGPQQLAFSQGILYVVDQGNKRVQEFSTTAESKAEYVGQFGSAGSEPGEFKKPIGIVASPATGDLFVSDEEGETVSQFTPTGKYLGRTGWWGTGENEFQSPSGLAVNATGSLYVADRYNNRLSIWQEPEAGGAHMSYSTQFGTAGSGEGQFEYPAIPAVDPHGNVWVADYGANKVDKYTSQGKFLASYGSEGVGNGQYNRPTSVAVNQATEDVYVGDCYNHRIQELGPKGEFIRAFTSTPLNCPGAIAIDSSGNVWTVDMAADELEEFSSTGTFLHAYGKKGKGNLEFEDPTGITIANSKVYIADAKNNRIQELSMTGEYLGQFGKEGSGGGEFYKPEGIAANSAGDLFVLDPGNNRIEEFSPTNKYLQSISNDGHGDGELYAPQGIAVTAAGDMYVADAGNHRIEKWVPVSQAVHDTKTIYYSDKEEAGVEACDNKPQWAGLACRTTPLAQPTDSSAEPKGEELSQLPVVTTEYNMWYEPVKTTEAIGSKTRTKTTTYKGERPTAQAVEASVGKTVPTVHDEYSSTLGMLVEQSIETESEGTKTISEVFNTLGQLESYTDAEGNATTYTYDQYSRPIEVDDDASKLDHMEAKQKLKYEETTGAVSEIEDLGGEGTYEGKGAGTFKATYDAEGNITSETYPNNMTAVYGYNSIGEATSLAYTKNNHCTGSECKWFEDSLTPSIHGEAMLQNSSLSKEQYRYEAPGRLAEVQETPAGEHCTARIYADNEEGDRTSLTTRESGTGECTATEGGKIERHTYDEANRLTDEEVQYEPLGNITKLPGVDAGKYELETEYYADGQARSQTQDGTTNTYQFDPEGRTRLTETKPEIAKIISHYAGPGGSTPSWTYNQTAGTWARNIVGFGGLVAVEESGKQAILQLGDLQGNIVGTASLNETVGTPKHMERSTEYGVPTSVKPEDKYGWLGTAGVSSNLPSGSVVQDGSTYVPQIGAPLQSAPPEIPAPAFSAIPYVLTVPPAQVINGNEEGDPCRRTFDNERLAYGGTAPVLTAWATVEWCYEGGYVKRPDTVNHGQHVYNNNLPTAWKVAGEWSFIKWLHNYGYGDKGTMYWVRWTAEFQYALIPTSKSPLSIVSVIDIILYFEFYGDGEYHDSVEVEKGLAVKSVFQKAIEEFL
jgi:tripartite motif-containing protein 71